MENRGKKVRRPNKYGKSGRSEGGREAGSGAEAANTWYYVHVIGDSTGVNPTSAVFSTSRTAGGITLPSGYDKSFVIPKFAVRNDASSDIIPFDFVGWPFAPNCVYNVTIARPNGTAGPTSVLDVAVGAAATSYTNVDCSSFIPPISTMGLFNLSGTAGASAAVVNVRPDGETHDGRGIVQDIDTQRYAPIDFMMKTSASQVIEYKSSVAAPKVQIAVVGWRA
jgi:hypothetical protein